ncbi:ead/Ea22-like family protein, partial [Escherichia coli]|uniref:ead/Ea22-like family protein n=1 Tax=Escherichia coli TaxID=562 RepID=UPI00207B3435
MTKINYQALREAAERAIPAMEGLLMLPVEYVSVPYTHLRAHETKANREIRFLSEKHNKKKKKKKK